VASFFVSRVDTAVDKKLDALISNESDEGRKNELRALQGKAAIANAKLAYAAYQEMFSGPRWEALASHGAKVQRCLWASTSTKNPHYRDVLYVEGLIGPDTVDTMPPATIDDFIDHGNVAPTLTQDVEGARTTIADIERAGISMDEVTAQLQTDGVRLFAESFNELTDTISKKREEMMTHA
jgi:transaldolase/glucose-6-phosphate isomerase